MLFTLLAAFPGTGAALLIPLAAIILTMGIPIVAIVFYYKHKSRIMDERKLMIEKGITPPELSAHLADARKKSPLSKGIDMLAVALGIISGYFASDSLGTIPPISMICAILFWLGVANICKSFLLKDEYDSHE